jgi:hypothetical protein
MTLNLTNGEALGLQVALEQDIRRLHEWYADRHFTYWIRRRDQMYNLYRKIGGQETLGTILREEQKEPAQPVVTE